MNREYKIDAMKRHAMLKLIYRGASTVSPWLASIIRESYFTLNGWRFQDVKDHIDRKVGANGLNTLSLDHSYREIMGGDPNPERIAFITNLPPDSTGIATCSFYSWLGHSGPVDIFCPVHDIDYFFSNGLRLKSGSQRQMRVLDVGAFLTADQTSPYKTIVVAAGNSTHCLYIHEVLRKILDNESPDRVVLYVHDPCLLNLIQRGAALRPAELVKACEAIYERQLFIAASDMETDDLVHAALTRANVLGVRYFFKLGITRYLVNSQAAADMVVADIAAPAATVMQIFHPAFLSARVDTMVASDARMECTAKKLLVLGTFGIPGAGKQTERIIAAAKEIQRSGTHVRLIIAGYNVRTYANDNASVLAGLDVRLFDGPTDYQLLRCMAEVDVAVQLRERNLGESSGIVAQLLCLGKSTLVSDIGAFKEFGSAVRSISETAQAHEIAQSILGLWRNPILRDNMQEYVEMRTPARFRDQLMNFIAK